MPAVTGSPGEEEEQAWLNVRAPWLGARRGAAHQEALGQGSVSY